VNLVTADDVKTKMGLPDNVLEADDAIESAISSGENFVRALLGTDTEYNASRTDTYLLRLNEFPPLQPFQRVKLRLKQGFVKTGTVVVMAGESYTSMAVVGDTEYRVDLTLGILHLEPSYLGQYVEVTYAAGFEQPADIPQWLKDAVLAYVPGVMNTMQVTNRSEEYSTTMKQSEELAIGILSSHMRGKALQHRPIY